MSRQGTRWTINEELSLFREYELLKMYIEDIAKKHERTPLSIVYKLRAEGLVTDITVEHYKILKNMNSKKVVKVVKDEEDDMSYDNDSSSDYVDEDDEESDDDDDDYEVEDEVIVEEKVEEKVEDEDDFDYKYADMPALIPADVEGYAYDTSEVDKLTDRVWGLETSVNQIGTMVKTLFDQLSFNKNNKKKLAPLRKTL